MIFSVTKNRKSLSKRKYNWDEKTRTFSSDEDGLVLDFSGINCVTFKTGSDCTFKTNWNCTFKTGYKCTFKTGSNCTFDTSWGCTFDTGESCTFDTGSHCTFKTGSHCAFNTDWSCTFKIGSNCIFTCDANCFVTRYDLKGVTEIPAYKTIKLNDNGIAGYTEVSPTHTIVIDGKEVEISDESFQNLKDSLTS